MLRFRNFWSFESWSSASKILLSIYLVKPLLVMVRPSAFPSVTLMQLVLDFVIWYDYVGDFSLIYWDSLEFGLVCLNFPFMFKIVDALYRSCYLLGIVFLATKYQVMWWFVWRRLHTLGVHYELLYLAGLWWTNWKLLVKSIPLRETAG